MIAFYFYTHGLQRVWRCQIASIQRIRCPWLNVCDDAWYRVFTDAEDRELNGRDALVEATVTVGVGEGIPCGEDVGGVR